MKAMKHLKMQATSSVKKEQGSGFFFKWVKESTDVINVSMYSKYNLEPV